MKKKITAFLLIIGLIVTTLWGCIVNSPLPDSNDTPDLNISENAGADTTKDNNAPVQESKNKIAEDVAYSAPEEVAEYIHTFGKLPKNFITKDEAEVKGWVSSKGNLWEVTDKKSIGGDIFGNREGKLPKKSGRTWYECDVNYNGGFRGGERVVYSNDELIYYTEDHYETFKKLY